MTIEQPESLLQAAISYANRGWRVFPLKPLAKTPLLPGSWPEYATNEPYQVFEWWTQHPEANIALVAGTAFTAVDIDRKTGGHDGWAAVGSFIDQSSVWCSTPNHGFHFYYQHPGSSLRSLPGVDIQQGNRYVVAPPSRLPEGHYVWGRAPDSSFTGGIKPMPQGLLDLLKRPDTPVDTTDQPYLLEAAPEVPLHRLKGPHQLFLQTGQHTGFASRSELIHSLTTRLYQLGLDDAQTLTWLWLQPWVQSLAMEHRQGDYERGIAYLWDSCKKVRHHRRLTPEQAFGNLQPDAGTDVIHKAQRLTPGEDIRPLLQEAAVKDLDPLAEDAFLNVLKEQGHSKQSVSKIFKEFKKALKVHANTLKWRHTVGEEERPLPTVENLEILLAAKKTSVRYNLMEHKLEIRNLHDKVGEEKLNSQLTAIRSWAAEHRMPMDSVKEQLMLIASKNEYHPFAEMVDGIAWDGTPRIQRVLDTLHVEPHRKRTRDVLVYRWLLSIVAAVYGYGNRAPRGVLTFVGPQQVGKTTWLKYLTPAGMYHQGHILRADNRDSVVKSLRYLVVELGEVGTTFRRQDIESLKNHIGQFEDVHRLPYAHAESSWRRRTIFAASANNTDLLKDQTGNTRWWVVPVHSIDLDTMETWWGEGYGYELLQFWKEVKMLYDQGEKWDLSDQELQLLNEGNDEFRDVPPIEGALLDAYQWEEMPPAHGYRHPRTLSQICQDIGIRGILSPHEAYQLREALRRHTGRRKAVQKRLHLAASDGETTEGPSRKGRYWYVPARSEFTSTEGPFNG